jgi:hypothetical protein
MVITLSLERYLSGLLVKVTQFIEKVVCRALRPSAILSTRAWLPDQARSIYAGLTAAALQPLLHKKYNGFQIRGKVLVDQADTSGLQNERILCSARRCFLIQYQFQIML